MEMICIERAPTHAKTPSVLVTMTLSHAGKKNGADPRSVYLGRRLPFQASERMPISILNVPYPGQADKNHLLHICLLDQLREDGGCNAGISHETGLATRLQTMRSYRSCIPNSSLNVWPIGLPSKSINTFFKIYATTLPRQQSRLNQSPERNVEQSSNSHHKGVGPKARNAASGAQSIAALIAGNSALGIEKWRSSALGTRHAGNTQQMPRFQRRKTIWPVKQRKSLDPRGEFGGNAAPQVPRLYLRVDSPSESANFAGFATHVRCDSMSQVV